ncbi:hypothetical protein [Xanthobacter sp. VNH20]|uniref:hypothetical protein n=1 Tax=Xanthobacter sp. VNH20 TaxID=3156616 RepID=UPI0032B36426
MAGTRTRKDLVFSTLAILQGGSVGSVKSRHAVDPLNSTPLSRQELVGVVLDMLSGGDVGSVQSRRTSNPFPGAAKTRQQLVMLALDMLIGGEVGQVESLRTASALPAAPRTRNELVLFALETLGVSSVGADASSEDYAAVDARVEPLTYRLYSEGVVLIADPDAIPAEMFIALGEILAADMMHAFAVGDEEAQRLAANAADAMARLKAVSRGRPTSGRVNDADYQTVDRQIDALLTRLYAQNIVLISNPNSIPPETFLSLGAVLAASLTASFGLTADSAAYLQTLAANAEARLKAVSKAKPLAQRASDADYGAVDRAIPPVIARLYAQDVFFIPNADQIPPAAFVAVGAVVAADLIETFSIGGDLAKSLISNAAAASLQLKTISRARTEDDRVWDQDYRAVDREIEPTLALLQAEEIAYIDDASEFEMEVFTPLSRVIAASLVMVFRVDLALADRIQAQAEVAKRSLQVMFRSRPTGQVMTAEYF